MAVVTLKPKREKSILRRHPWVFSGAIQRISGSPAPGETVDVLASDGTRLACGAFSPHSQITIRIWSFDPSEKPSPSFFARCLEKAISLRRSLSSLSECNAYRLIHAESDGLPGIIVDRYGSFLVCQFLTTGAELWRDIFIRELARQVPAAGIFERSDAEVRFQEGLEKRSGPIFGESPPELLTIRENGIAYFVDIRNGHKTGFYLDQRENRRAVTEWTRSKEVLNVFSYTGGFGLNALRGGAASILNIDTSPSAIALSRRNLELNGFSESQVEHIRADAFSALRQIWESGRRFDLVILDPPKFVDSRSHLEKACRGYKDMNRLGFMLLREDGFLLTFSCSGRLSQELFQKVVADAALDAHRPANVLQRFSQSADHSVLLSFPEGNYLKGLLVKG